MCHDQQHDDLRLRALFHERLRVHGLHVHDDGGARRERAVLLRQRVRLRRVRLPAELRLRVMRAGA